VYTYVGVANVKSLYHYKETLEFGPNEPQAYSNKPVDIFLTTTSTLAPIFTDQDLTVPIANSRVVTNEFGELSFFADLPLLDFVRVVGGRRSVIEGDPGGADEFTYTRAMFFS